MCGRIRAVEGGIMIITSLLPGEGAHYSRFQIGWKFYISLEFTAITRQRKKAVLVTEARMAMCDWPHLIND